MYPTLDVGTSVVISEALSRKRSVGDIVICHSPTNPAQCVCKRIVAVVCCRNMSLLLVLLDSCYIGFE